MIEMFDMILCIPLLSFLPFCTHSVIPGWLLECIRKDGHQASWVKLAGKRKAALPFYLFGDCIVPLFSTVFNRAFCSEHFFWVSHLLIFRLLERDGHLYGMDLGIHLGRARAWVGPNSGKENAGCEHDTDGIWLVQKQAEER